MGKPPPRAPFLMSPALDGTQPARLLLGLVFQSVGSFASQSPPPMWPSHSCALPTCHSTTSSQNSGLWHCCSEEGEAQLEAGGQESPGGPWAGAGIPEHCLYV